MGRATERLPAATWRTGRPTGTRERAPQFLTVPGQPQDPSMETRKRLEATLHPVARAASVRGPSAATNMADRQKAIRRAAAPAWEVEPRVGLGRDMAVVAVAAEHVAAVVADADDRGPAMFRVAG